MDGKYQKTLTRDGFVVIDGLDPGPEVERRLRDYGDLLPQYDGQIAFEVKPLPGFESYRFSQSLNPIGPHTEAPVQDPPPKYLALYCHRQATCGGGQTLLSDGYAFLDTLDASLRQVAESWPIRFVASTHPGGPVGSEADFPMLSRPADAHPILRFSHNQFYFGDVNPQSNAESGDPIVEEASLKELAARGTAHFRNNAIDIRIPEGSLLIWDNHRMLHARDRYRDPKRHLTRYWIA